MHAKGRAYTILEPLSPSERRQRFVERMLTAGVLIALAALVVGAALFAYLHSDVRAVEVSRLSAMNDALRAQNQGFREDLSRLVERVATLQEAVGELSSRARLQNRLEPLDRLSSLTQPKHIGKGGGDHQDLAFSPALATSPEDMFGTLRASLDDLEARTGLLQAAYAQRDRLLAATPTLWPAQGWLSATFGRRPDPFTGEPDFHEGIDISAERGRPVYATADGRVARAEFRGGYGNTIVIDHGFGLATRYAHLSRFAVKAGDHVHRGQVIGSVGNTGKSTGPHLHYEVWANGHLMNPLRPLFDRIVARR